MLNTLDLDGTLAEYINPNGYRHQGSANLILSQV